MKPNGEKKVTLMLLIAVKINKKKKRNIIHRSLKSRSVQLKKRQKKQAKQKKWQTPSVAKSNTVEDISDIITQHKEPNRKTTISPSGCCCCFVTAVITEQENPYPIERPAAAVQSAGAARLQKEPMETS